MKILPLSDLHLEWGSPPPKYTFCEDDKQDTVAILAGDIANNVSGVWYAEEYICPYVRHVIYVPGNHEYYGYEFYEVDRNIRNEIEKRGLINMTLLNAGFPLAFGFGGMLAIDDVLFIGATLWTSLNNRNPLSMETASRYMNDYNAIRDTVPSLYSGGRNTLQVETTVALHAIQSSYIETTLKDMGQNMKIVVATHHLPSYRLIAPWFRKSGDRISMKLSHAYASDLDTILRDTPPNLRIHGHSHVAHDLFIENTRVVSNALGYPGSYVRGFNPDLRIEI